MRKRPFTLLELMAALTVFLICLDLISSVIINTHKAQAYNDSRFRISLTMENVLQELKPDYSYEDLEKILEDEEVRNKLKGHKISWNLKKAENTAQLTFMHRQRTVFNTELELKP